MNKARLLLVRHGQSVANLMHMYIGHTDLDLSELGFRQAALTAEYLKDVKIDAVYSSNLLRAYHTALPHAIMRNLSVHYTPRLKEIFLGEWENTPGLFLKEKFHDEFYHGWVENFGLFTPPGGESVVALGERIYGALFDIARENLGKTVLVGLHAAAIRTFYAKVLGVAPCDLAKELDFPANGSVTTVDFDGEGFVPVGYSDVEHLRGVDLDKL